MSSIYNLEPQPTASAIIHTTDGDLAVELFAKQTPLTCRNFLQLSLDGYYDNTIFHRLVPGFIIQGGDPTGTGHGGESIYDGGAFSGDLDPWPMDQRRGKNVGPTGTDFKDEFHSRLKFNRRGLIGMANEGSPDTNGSQFFFTLDKADELTNKNTVFGRIAGNTIYNLMRMGEAELQGEDRPLYPTKITRIRILINPFDDMQKRERIAPARAPAMRPSDKKQKKRKAAKQLLSFGDEGGEDEELNLPKKTRFDTRIAIDIELESLSSQGRPRKVASGAKQRPVMVDKAPTVTEAPTKPPPTGHSPSQASRSVLSWKKEAGSHGSASPERLTPELEVEQKSLLEKANDEFESIRALMKRSIQVEAVKEKKSTLEQMVPETSTRGRRRRPGTNNMGPQDEQVALNMLYAFKSKLDQTPTERKPASNSRQPRADVDDGKATKQEGDEGKACDLHFIANCQSCHAWDMLEDKADSNDEGWMGHSLCFAADKLGKDLTFRQKAEEKLVVIDPQAKARTLQEERKADRESRAGEGRAWDQARNTRLARNAALAGRGAR